MWVGGWGWHSDGLKRMLDKDQEDQKSKKEYDCLDPTTYHNNELVLVNCRAPSRPDSQR